MAVTADTVQVRLEANVSKYLSDLNKAGGGFDKLVQRMNADVRSSGLAFSDLRIQATQAVADTQQQVNKFNTANIAAQFQDIGVTAAAGMNPLIIALQQGTQLSAVLNAEIGKGVNPVKALGGAFLQIINPISLATIAAVALGAAVLQGIGSIVPKTESANEAIKRHREALEGIVRGYSAAEDAVDQYFEAANRLPQSVASVKTREEFVKLSEEVEKFRSRAAQIADAFEGVGSAAEQKIGTAARHFSDGEISAEDFYLALQETRSELNWLETTIGAFSVARFLDEMEAGVQKAIAFGDELNTLISLSHSLAGLGVDTDLQNALDLKTYIAEQERINGLTTEQLQLEREIARIKSEAGEFGITDAKAAELAEQTLAAEKRRAEIARQLREGGKSGDKAAREYDRERQAIEDLLESMGFQAALLGQSNREKAIAIALSKANATATEEELRQIEQVAGFIYDTEHAIDELNKSSQEWADTIQSATRGFIDDLIAGKDAAEAFSNVLSNIASKLIDVGLNSLFGGGGFNLAGLFGGGGFPTRAMGGNVYAGQPTMINERGQEIFVPTQPGRMVPASQVNGGGSVVFAPNIDARGADVAAVARLEQSLQRLAAEVVPTIRKEIANGPKKGRR